ncbi:MAG: carbohydrate ABC transporter permease [Clostridiaceae bacterium]|nr:carbohydrate ABC transporter permease [Clostridiaceae bacterium]
MRNKRLLTTLKYIIITIAALIGLFPFILLVLTSIKTSADAFSMPPKWIFIPTLKNYILHLKDIEIIENIKNSFIIAGSSTLISTFLGVFSGYALTRFVFRGNRILTQSILWLRMIPPIVLIIPYFVIFGKLQMYDTYLGMIAVYITITLPLITWMMFSFYREIPIEIEEAALVDGCNRWMALRYAIIPAVVPGIFAASSLSFIYVWNEFIYAMFLTGKTTRTLPVEMYNAIGFYALDWGKLTSLAVIAIIPAIIFISLTQKYIVRGLTMGAVKG